MKLYKLLLLLFIFSFFYSCETEEIPTTPYTGRTILVYLIADNNISASLYNNIQDILDGMKNYGKRCEVVIYWDGPTSDPTLSKYIVNDKGKFSNEIVLTTYSEQDSTDPEVMTRIFQDFFRLCPSESYGLIMGSHAYSWLPQEQLGERSRGFGDDSGNEIAITDLAEVLRSVIPKPFDYILFDACLMGSIEVLYELRKVAEYIISSPAEILAYGFNYYDIMAFLYSNDVNDYTNKVAEKFISFYADGLGFATIAVAKCSEMDNLALSTQKILSAYSYELESFLPDFLQRYDRNGLRYTYFAFDFEQFIRELATEEEYLIFMNQFDKTIIYKNFVNISTRLITINPDNYSGVSSYVMQSRHKYLNEYYKTLSWYYASGWNTTSW